MTGRLLMIIGLLWLGACNASPKAADSGREYTGTLQGGMMAIGGEHTGWVLRQGEPAGDLEVDLSQVPQEARAMEGQRVRITGHIQEKAYVERGRTPILVAETIEPAESP